MVHQIISLQEVIKLKQNFQKLKNKVVTGKTPSFVIGAFVRTILFVLALTYAFLIVVLSTKKRQVLQFFEKGFRFPENLFQC